MKTKLLLATAVFAVVGLVLAGVASAAFVAIYRNALETTAQRSEVRKFAGKECTRGGAKTTLSITVGKLTEECAYSTPVVGSNLEIAATGSINPATPPKVAKKPSSPCSCGRAAAASSSCASFRPNRRSRSLGPPKVASSTWRSRRTSSP